MDELTYNGKKFSEFDTFFDGSKAFGTPEKDYELVEVMGRNGSLSIYNDRFKDIQLPFPCFIRSNFVTRFRALTEYLNSQQGYQKLETSKEPNHYRKALFQGIVEPQTTPFNHGGFFTINFLAKPQRFLKSGDTPVSADAHSESYSGSVAEVDNPSGLDTVTALSVDINPIQDLHGYDHPWVGGAGKNKLGGLLTTTGTQYGVTYTANSDGSFTVNGTNSYSGISDYRLSGTGQYSLTLPVGDYLLSGGVDGLNGTGNTLYIAITNNGVRYVGNKSGNGTSFTIGEGDVITSCFVRMASGATASNAVFKPMIRLASETDASFEPYENIAPITGFDEVEVTRVGKNLFGGMDFANKLVEVGYRSVISGNTVNFTHGAAISGNYFRPIFSDFKTNTVYTIRFDYEASAVNNSLYIELADGTRTNIRLEPTSEKTSFIYNTASNRTIKDFGLTFYSDGRVTLYIDTIGIFEGADAEFEPYQITTYPVSFSQAGTVYGGTVDVVSGVLTVDRASFTTSNASDISRNTAHNFYVKSSSLPVPAKYKDTTAISCLSNKFESHTTTSAAIYGICFLDSSSAIRFNTVGEYASVTEMLEDIGELQFIYDCVPQTYQLTPQQVELLTGLNYISADSGDVVVTVSSPANLENPTLFETKPLIRCYGTGTVNINDQYITISSHPYEYIDIDCELMDAKYGLNNANQYVSFSTTDYITLKVGDNYIAHNLTKVEITPRWYEI